MGDGDTKAQAHLRVGGKDYHVVAAVLMMLGLIESYLHYQEVVPVFTGEVAHRIVELLKVCLLACQHACVSPDSSGLPLNMRAPCRQHVLPGAVLTLLPWAQGCSACQGGSIRKTQHVHVEAEYMVQVFNSRTCQLVLGAGALAAAGLRSITAKHLAMAAQCVGAIMGLHPSLTAILTGPLPHTRRAILLPDFERLLQVRHLQATHPGSRYFCDTLLTLGGKVQVTYMRLNRC